MVRKKKTKQSDWNVKPWTGANASAGGVDSWSIQVSPFACPSKEKRKKLKVGTRIYWLKLNKTRQVIRRKEKRSQGAAQLGKIIAEKKKRRNERRKNEIKSWEINQSWFSKWDRNWKKVKMTDRKKWLKNELNTRQDGWWVNNIYLNPN